MRKKIRTKGHSSIKDKILKRAQERENYGRGNITLTVPEGMEFFSPKKGTMNLDIIPYKVSADNHPEVAEGELWYQRTVFKHFGIGPEEKSFICPKTIGKRCPICEEHAKLRRDPDADEDTVNALRPKERELFNVIDLDDEDKGVQLWEFSYHLFGRILEEELRDGDESNASFSDLKGGKTLAVKFREKKIGKNKFVEAVNIEFEDREEDYDEDILEDAVDLDKALVVLEHDALQKEFLGMSEDSEEEEESETKEKKVAKEIDEEKEEEIEEIDDTKEDEDDEEDENEEPKKKVKKSVKIKDDEEDDDFDWDEDVDNKEDDEEEAEEIIPKKSSKKHSRRSK